MCALRVVLTVDRSPLFRHHSGGEPQPEPEEVACNRMQGERVMRLVAMQEYRYRNDSDVGQQQGSRHYAPPRQVEYAREPAHFHGFAVRAAMIKKLRLHGATSLDQGQAAVPSRLSLVPSGRRSGRH